MIELLLLINLQRSISLIPDHILTERAQIRAEQMYHGNRQDWKNSFEGIKCWTKGENMAKGLGNEQMNNLMLSLPVYRQNLLNPYYNKVGIGNYGGYGGVTVELFCGE